MSMKPFAHANATSPEEAIAALDAGTRPLAGGTDLLARMKAGLIAPERLVNLKTVSELGRITVADDGWHIGAMATLSEIAEHASIHPAPEMACLYQAILQSASPQLRHMATLGGNLVQEPRCWYYRHPQVPCWRKGGRMCYAFSGDNREHVLFDGGPCFAVHPSDPAVALMALGAAVTVLGPDGQRTLPLRQFYRKPDRDRRSDHSLAEDELIIEVFVPRWLEGASGAYVKVAGRAAWDFALASAAVQAVVAQGRVQMANIALGGVAPYPWRAEAAEALLVGQPLSDETIQAAADAATKGARTLEHNGYKVQMLRGVVKEALNQLR
ncbi:MAG: FAD binding domain-containing protein [Anaerolineae bacterium]|nr:FAD binding domain-containing protein [Anaerolineae bacterium]